MLYYKREYTPQSDLIPPCPPLLGGIVGYPLFLEGNFGSRIKKENVNEITDLIPL